MFQKLFNKEGKMEKKLLAGISMATIVAASIVLLSGNVFSQGFGGGQGGGYGGGETSPGSGVLYHFDADGNGEISKQEFDDAGGDESRWARWDANGDGVVDGGEVASVGPRPEGGGSSGGMGGGRGGH